MVYLAGLFCAGQRCFRTNFYTKIEMILVFFMISIISV